MSLADVNFLLSRLVPSCGGAAVFLRVPQRELLFIAAVRTFALQQAQFNAVIPHSWRRGTF